jgi:septal ring factor EnvC (AmiA/AmiB activator)
MPRTHCRTRTIGCDALLSLRLTFAFHHIFFHDTNVARFIYYTPQTTVFRPQLWFGYPVLLMSSDQMLDTYNELCRQHQDLRHEYILSLSENNERWAAAKEQYDELWQTNQRNQAAAQAAADELKTMQQTLVNMQENHAQVSQLNMHMASSIAILNSLVNVQAPSLAAIVDAQRDEITVLRTAVETAAHDTEQKYIKDVNSDRQMNDRRTASLQRSLETVTSDRDIAKRANTDLQVKIADKDRIGKVLSDKLKTTEEKLNNFIDAHKHSEHPSWYDRCQVLDKENQAHKKETNRVWWVISLAVIFLSLFFLCTHLHNKYKHLQ